MHLKIVAGSFSFRKRLGTFEDHLTELVKKSLKQMRIDNALISVWCTKYIHIPDVFWNKLFRGCIMEFYHEWLASGEHYHTKSRNMKPTSRHLIVTSILEAWTQLVKELIIRSIKSCALRLKSDSIEDKIIHYFKGESPCWEGASLLKDQVNI